MTIFLLFLFLVITKKEANVSIKSVHFISVLWMPRGYRSVRSPLNPAL
jgi:hypothetical protein